MVMLPVDRIERHVAQRVVHPSHVPFQIESEPSDVGGPRNRRPGRGFLCDRQRAGMADVQNFVEPLQEGDGFQILAPAERVGNPFAGLARIVQIEHRSDRIHAQAVNVVFAHPEQRIGEQEILHFVAAVIEDQRSPVGMRARRGSACS